MQIVRFPGATYVQAGEHRILFGTFPEIHQHLMKQGLAWPNVIVFSDVLIRDRLPQMVPEFLFFGHVFFNRNFDYEKRVIKTPLIFLGTKSQVERAARIMDLSYLGMTPELVARGLDPERVAFLQRECDHYALKNHDGNVIPTRDYLDLRTWDHEDAANLDGGRISRTGMLTYRVEFEGETVEVDLGAGGRQGPAWVIPEVSELRTTHPFSLRILGAAGAFQHVAPSTSYLMTLNGEHYLIDCSPYVNRTLSQFGITVEQIKGIFISHVHDDHTGDLVTFALNKGRTDLFASKEVWEALKLKLAAILDTEESTIEAYFRFREIVPGQALMLGGARLDFHDACHAVPCVGMTLTVGEDQLVITSDTSGHRQLLDMRSKGIISEERFEALEALLQGQNVIVDCGEAIIHGYIEDFLHLADHSNLVLAHRHSLPEQYRDAFTLASPLQLFELGPQDETVCDAAQIGRILDAWHLADLWGWMSLMALHRHVREPLVGETVLLQGSKADHFYIITHGLFDVLVDGKKVAQLKAGDFFGELAFINGQGKRQATVVATTPCRMLEIPGEFLESMLKQEDARAHEESRETLSERLLRLWENREFISRVRVFASLDVQTLNAFSLRLERVQMGPREVVIEKDSHDDSACYLVVKGTLQVEANDETERPILRESDLFGEGVAGGFTNSRSATIRTLEPCTLLKLSQQDLKTIGRERPQVLFALRELVEQRHYLGA